MGALLAAPPPRCFTSVTSLAPVVPGGWPSGLSENSPFPKPLHFQPPKCPPVKEAPARTLTGAAGSSVHCPLRPGILGRPGSATVTKPQGKLQMCCPRRDWLLRLSPRLGPGTPGGTYRGSIASATGLKALLSAEAIFLQEEYRLPRGLSGPASSPQVPLDGEQRPLRGSAGQCSIADPKARSPCADAHCPPPPSLGRPSIPSTWVASEG